MTTFTYIYYHLLSMTQRSYCGYRSALTIMNLTETDISEIEKFSNRLPGAIKAAVKSRNGNSLYDTVHDFFFGLYGNETDQFEFPPGDRKTLMLIKKAAINIASQGNAVDIIDGSAAFGFNENIKKCLTIDTPVGVLFSDKVQLEELIQPTNNSVTTATVGHPSSCNLTPPLLVNAEIIDELVEILHAGLVLRMKNQLQKMLQEGIYDKEAEEPTIEIDKNSVQTVLISKGVIHSESNNPNESCKLIKAKIKCFCTRQGRNICVTFALKSVTLDVIRSVLDKGHTATKEMDAALVKNHFCSCWCLSNYLTHNKKIHHNRKYGEYLLKCLYAH